MGMGEEMGERKKEGKIKGGNNAAFSSRGMTIVAMQHFLRATAGTAIARLSHRNSVCPSVRLSVRHTGGSGKNGAS